jgi:hypothetical protein
MDEMPPQNDPALGQLRHAGARCAFCGKGKDQAGVLVESEVEGIYICYACARLCAVVIEEECKQRGLPVPEC